MTERRKKPKIRIPLPKKTEKRHRDKTRYSRKRKYKQPDIPIGESGDNRQ